MGYDPRACGALCDRCVLSGQRVVPPEVGYSVTPDKIRSREAICIVGEAPGDQEERTGRPFVGRSGEELDKALHRAGFPRQNALVTNVLLCRPPKNELNELLSKIKRENNERVDAYKTALKEATKAGQPLPPPPVLLESPIDCCAPRLEREIANFENFLTLGKVATSAITRSKVSIQAIRGSLNELEATPITPHRKVLPTVHPAFCLRYPRWFHVFHADVEKAGKWFRGEIEWRPPTIRWQPSPEQLARFLDQHKGRILSCDIETDGIEALTANVRCVGVGTADEVLVVSLLSKDGRTRFYSMRDEAQITDIIKQWLADPSAQKTGHNFGGYDKVVLRERWGAEVNGVIDTMLLHRVVESELPHSLAYVVSMFTIAPAWKTSREGNKLATDSETDEQLAAYCGYDVALTARVLFPLIEAAQQRDQIEVFIGDSKIQAVCADMHTVGMYVDQAERQKIEVDALHRRKRILADIRSFLGRPGFNPGSIYQLRDLLFEEWKLVPPLEDEERLTASDDPSTSDLVLRALLTDPGLSDDHRHLISLVRRYRKLQKVLGTYIVKLRPANVSVEGDLGWDTEDWEGDGPAEVEMRKRYGLEKKGIVDPYTGRMYPGYNAAVAVTGRLSSSRPINCFDGETEVLTPEGWVRFDCLKQDVEVAQWHADGSISFVRPQAYHEGDVDGSMIVFQSQSADLVMTPNHRLPLMKASGIVETVTADTLLSTFYGRDTIHAGRLRRPMHPTLPISLDELRLLVSIHADGSFTRSGSIDIGFKKPRKAERFTALLSRLSGYDWSQTAAQGGRFRYRLARTPRLEQLVALIGGPERVWGSWLLSLSREEAEVFEEEIWFWDGCWERRSQYANKDKRNVDLVQAFLVTFGIRTNIRLYTNRDGNSVWVADVRRTRTNAITPRRYCEAVPYSGRVYCVTVPADALVVRRRGKVTVTRQSQNVPAALRVMITAAPGHVLVGADMDQLELRIAAARWGVKLYLRAFEEEKDPHSMTAFAVFGEAFCRAAGIDPAMFSRPGKLIGAAYDEGGKFKLKEGDAYKMRTLSKMVQYACIGSTEHIAVLGPECSKPISEMHVGDWTWAWSRKRQRYEPAEVVAVVPQGRRSCVRVHYVWGSTDQFCGSVVVTTDHLCIMRDGQERAAQDLVPGDRLMPFRRDTGSRYRQVFPFNDDRRMGEHRVVAGFYEVGSTETDVHHKNENAHDNRPANLEVLPEEVHYSEHADALAQGRMRSAAWRASVSDPATRSAASLKAWEGRRERKDTDGAYAQRSFLEDWRDIIGVESDAIVAEKAGCTPEAVAYFRKTRGIAPPPGQKGWLQHLFENDAEWRAQLLGNHQAMRGRLLATFNVDVPVTTLRRERRRWYPNYSSADKWAAVADILGHRPDAEVGELIGVSQAAVWAHRQKHGIPLYYRDAPEGTNHRVVRIEPVGEQEVWDIEVDHEDHNFALASGIFVHNSQYKAAVETVAMLIRKTEVPARDKDGNELKDGTTELPYALMPLRRVREMHQNWLRGASEFKTGWAREIHHFKRHGYVQEYVTGRKRYFLDTAQSRDEKMSGTNEIVNFPIQCVPGYVLVLTEYGYVPICEVEGKTFRAWTGKRWASATCIQKGRAALWRVRVGRLHLDCDQSHSLRRRDGTWATVRELQPGDEVEMDFGKRECGRLVDLANIPVEADAEVPDVVWRADWQTREAYARRLRDEVHDYSWEQHLLMQTVQPDAVWATVESIRPLYRQEPVYTLCVDDEDHSYVADGFISKNSSAAGLMNKALIQLHEQIPLNKWGPGTGIINQCHDSIVIECPADGCEEVAVTDPKTGKVKKQMVVRPGSIPEKVARLLEECMNQTDPSLPGVKITATAVVGRTWKDV